MPTYPYQVKKEEAISLGVAICIPDLGIEVDLSDKERRDAVRRYGIERFVKSTILTRLIELDEADEEPDDPQPLESYKHTGYDLYLMTYGEIKPKKIPGKAIILIGTDLHRVAYFVENNKMLMRDGVAVTTDILLSTHELSIFMKDHKPHQPVAKNDETQALMEPIFMEATSAAGLPYFSLHDQWGIVDVEFTSPNRNHFFANTLHGATEASYLLETLANTILTVASLQTAGSTIPMDDTAADIVNITQSLLYSAFYIYMIFSTPGIENLRALGNDIDRFLHKIYNKLTCKKSNAPKEKCCNIIPKSFAIKVGLLLLALNYLYADATSDYVSYDSYNATLTEDSTLPAWLLLSASWSAYALNQANDPVVAFGFLKFVFQKIDAYFRSKKPSLTPKTTDSYSQSAADAKQDLDSPDFEAGNNLRVSLLHDEKKEPHSPRLFSNTKPPKVERNQQAKRSFCLVM